MADPIQLPAGYQDAKPIQNSPVQLPAGYEDAKPQNLPAGLARGDTGYTIVTPKEGESFSDTLKRATDRWKGLTPQEQEQELRAAQTGMGKKAAQTMAAAAGIGLAGPATLAGMGALGEAAPAIARAVQPIAKATLAFARSNAVPAVIGIHIARELGIPVPKVLDILAKFGGGE